MKKILTQKIHIADICLYHKQVVFTILSIIDPPLPIKIYVQFIAFNELHSVFFHLIPFEVFFKRFLKLFKMFLLRFGMT